MQPYFIAIPLPFPLQSKLASFCYGLPHVRWVEEGNFYLTLRYLGSLSDVLLAELEERLESLFFQSFSIVLQGVGHFQSKGQRGSLWIGVAHSPALLLLKKQINNQLRGIPLLSEERFQPHITLGYYERLNPQKLGDYLSSLADYQSDSIEVTSCQLLRIQHTPKHTIYQIIHSFSASPQATGED